MLGAASGLVVGVAATVILGMALTFTDDVAIGTFTYGRGGDLAAFALRPGDCATATLEGDPEIGEAVDCSQLHDVEVALAEQLPAVTPERYDAAALSWFADDACSDAFDPYVGAAYLDSEYDYTVVVPSEEAWAGGARDAYCLIWSYEGATRGSAKGSGR
jgi:hypothetical protein